MTGLEPIGRRPTRVGESLEVRQPVVFKVDYLLDCSCRAVSAASFNAQTIISFRVCAAVEVTLAWRATKVAMSNGGSTCHFSE